VTVLARSADPIVAIATAPGRGAVGIVRVSGRSLAPLIEAICGRQLRPREATYLPFRDRAGEAIDQGLALHFPAPHSFTGEDVLELQAHGGAIVLQLLLARCLEAAIETLQLFFERVNSPMHIRHLEVDPDLDDVRGDSRFKDMLAGAKQRLGIAEAPAS